MSRRINNFKIINSEEDIKKYYDDDEPTRKRMKIQKWQHDILEENFKMNVYPNKMENIRICQKTKMPIKNVKVWFQNRRAKEKMLLE